MTEAAARSAPGTPGAALGSVATAALVLVVAGATVVAVVVGNGDVGVALVPIVVATVLSVVVRAPLRWTTAALLLLMLAIDTTMVEGSCPEGLVCRWRTPLVFLGDLVHGPLPGLPVTGMEVAVVGLLAVGLYRRIMGSRVDTDGQAPAPMVLREFVLLYVVAVLFAEVNGLARGGVVAPWKLRYLLHPIALLLLFNAAFRGPRDHRLVGGVIVFCATFRAILAVVIQTVAKAQSGGPLESGTSHGDSALFAVGMFLLLADLMERATRGRLLRAVALLPILFWGTVQNDRRLAWVMLGMVLALAYVMSPARGWKRSLTQVVAVAMPVILLYVAVGWKRDSFVFRPVRIFRSVTDTSMDHSAYWREVENWNILMSMREAPVLGIGLGHQYREYMRNDDISASYAEFREWPHNSVLGLLLLLGLPAFTATWLLPALGAFLATRAYRFAKRPGDRAAALTCLGTLLACHLLAWGDTGAHFPQYKILLALALAVSGKLATATGAWPARRSRPAWAGAATAEVGPATAP